MHLILKSWWVIRTLQLFHLLESCRFYSPMIHRFFFSSSSIGNHHQKFQKKRAVAAPPRQCTQPLYAPCSKSGGVIAVSRRAYWITIPWLQITVCHPKQRQLSCYELITLDWSTESFEFVSPFDWNGTGRRISTLKKSDAWKSTVSILSFTYVSKMIVITYDYMTIFHKITWQETTGYFYDFIIVILGLKLNHF